MRNEEELKRGLRGGLDRITAGPELRRRTMERIVAGERNRDKPVFRFFPHIALPAFMVLALILILSLTADRHVQQQPVSKVVLPEYVPEGYRVNEVVTEAGKDAETPEVVIRYSASGDNAGKLEWKQSAKPGGPAPEGFEPVTFEGRQAWIRRTGDDNITLLWEDEKYEYRLEGKISEGDAKLMAGSIYLHKKEDDSR